MDEKVVTNGTVGEENHACGSAGRVKLSDDDVTTIMILRSEVTRTLAELGSVREEALVRESSAMARLASARQDLQSMLGTIGKKLGIGPGVGWELDLASKTAIRKLDS